MKYINQKALKVSLQEFKKGKPFHHVVIDDFFNIDIAMKLETEFLPYDSDRWFFYNNAIENKKAFNDWNFFPRLTYDVFTELMSPQLIDLISSQIGCKLYIDHGLHGGGWHIHGQGGNLNPHLDYSIHPKLELQRKLNIIIYLSSGLKSEHGGYLGLWSQDAETGRPSDLVTEVQPVFNRAVLFDTTQNSWHGMSRPLTQPHDVFRKSIAVYYLTDPSFEHDGRRKALFAPRSEQMGDRYVEELIRIRSDSERFYEAYQIKEDLPNA
jgi:Rps23 Pro-64 3,4-dihydroxylase Tpa1-like proline 4-hydroxylase